METIVSVIMVIMETEINVILVILLVDNVLVQMMDNAYHVLTLHISFKMVFVQEIVLVLMDFTLIQLLEFAKDVVNFVLSVKMFKYAQDAQLDLKFNQSH